MGHQQHPRLHHIKAQNAFAAGNTVANAAYDQSFDYPNQPSRLYKKKEGISPSEYRNRIK